MKEIDPSGLTNVQMQKILQGSVAPRPIALASTIDSDGNPNLAPFSFYNAFGVNPTTLIFSPSRRGRDNTLKNTYENIKEVPEVVINVVNYEMVQQVSLSSTEYPKGVNEFEKVGFHQIKSVTIRPFRVMESPVQYECSVRQVIETSDRGGAANLVICEIQMIHIREDILDHEGLIDQNKIRLVGRMGGDFYVRAFDDGLFKVRKPLDKIGIGVDQLPESVRLSKVLTGNHLGQLGNLEHFPNSVQMAEGLEMTELQEILQSKLDKSELKDQVHRYAASLIDAGEVMKALTVLIILENVPQ